MTDRESRERLVELIFNAPRTDVIYGDIKLDKPIQTAQTIADHLLANGVIVLPCKVGQTVYEFGCNDPFGDPLDLYVVESTVSGIAVFTSEDIHNMNCFGKTVFLTKEEAEAKLKELK